MEAIFCTECGARNPLNAEGSGPDAAGATPAPGCVACGARLELELAVALAPPTAGQAPDIGAPLADALEAPPAIAETGVATPSVVVESVVEPPPVVAEATVDLPPVATEPIVDLPPVVIEAEAEERPPVVDAIDAVDGAGSSAEAPMVSVAPRRLEQPGPSAAPEAAAAAEAAAEAAAAAAEVEAEAASGALESRREPEVEVAPGLRSVETADPLLAAAIAAYSGAARVRRETPVEPAPAEPGPAPAISALPVVEIGPARPPEAAPESTPGPTAVASTRSSEPRISAPAHLVEPEPTRSSATDAPVASSVHGADFSFPPPRRPSALLLGVAALAVVGAFFLGRSSVTSGSGPQATCPPKTDRTAALITAPPLSAASDAIATPSASGAASNTVRPKAAVATPTRAPLAGAQSKAPFDAKAAGRALKVAAARASSCKRPGDPRGSAVVTITFANTGHAVAANVSGAPFAGTPTASCIANLLRSARVPAFAGEPVTVKKTISL